MTTSQKLLETKTHTVLPLRCVHSWSGSDCPRTAHYSPNPGWYIDKYTLKVNSQKTMEVMKWATLAMHLKLLLISNLKEHGTRWWSLQQNVISPNIVMVTWWQSFRTNSLTTWVAYTLPIPIGSVLVASVDANKHGMKYINEKRGWSDIEVEVEEIFLGLPGKENVIQAVLDELGTLFPCQFMRTQ